LGCFSFYPGKNLGACGEGGIVVTNDQKHAHTIRMLRDWGAESKYHHLLKGYNYRMEGIQGAILRVKLRHLEKWTEARRAHALRYNELLKDTGVGIPCEMPFNRHVYHIYAVRVPQRDRQVSGRVNGTGRSDRHPLPDPGSSPTGICGSRLQGRGFSLRGSGCKRSAVLADVSRIDFRSAGCRIEGRAGGIQDPVKEQVYCCLMRKHASNTLIISEENL